jgi:hypothetical protein
MRYYDTKKTYQLKADKGPGDPNPINILSDNLEELKGLADQMLKNGSYSCIELECLTLTVTLTDTVEKYYRNGKYFQ